MSLENPDPMPAPQSPAAPRPVTDEVIVHWEGAGRKPWTTYAIIALIIGVYIGQMTTPLPEGGDLLATYGAKVNNLIVTGEYWRLITATFLHSSLIHLAFSVYGIYILGKLLEKHYGHGGTLGLFLLAALGGNTASFLFSARSSIGSATALFGMLAALIVLVDRNRFFFGERAGRIIWQMVLLVLVNLALSLVPGFDSLGVVGGLVSGLTFALIAGPVWHVVPGEDGFHLSDRTPRHRRLIGGLALAMIFVLAAFTQIR